MNYVDIDSGLNIHFTCSELDLQDIALVSKVINESVNKIAALRFELYQVVPELYWGNPSKPKWQPPHYLSPAVISLAITDLQYESFKVSTNLRVNRLVRDVIVGAAGSLVATVILSIGESAPKSLLVESVKNEQGEKVIDVGSNLREMTKYLSQRDKAWELSVEDSNTGQKVIIRSK